MPKSIFISYRRENDKYPALKIFEAFQKTNVRAFYDADSIPLGRDFRKVIIAQVQKCDVLLALVGRNWAECLDLKTGLRRLENPDDFVRIEIGTALSRGIPVVPVILDDAPMPAIDQLPNELSNLFNMHAEFISFRTFDDDVKRLITKLKIKSTQEPSEPTNIIQASEPAPKDQAAGYSLVGEMPTVGTPQTQLKDLFDGILKYPPRFLLTFAQLFSRPKKFIAGRELNSEQEWMNALIFFAISTVLSSVLMMWAYPNEKNSFGGLVTKDLADQLLYVTLGAVAIRLSWRLVGGKATARSFFVVYAYLGSVALVIFSVFSVFAMGGLKMLDPKLYEKVVGPTSPSFGDLCIGDYPGRVYCAIVYLGLFATAVWAISSWGAFRSLTGSSKLRSFFAFIISAISFIPLVIIQILAEVAMDI